MNTRFAVKRASGDNTAKELVLITAFEDCQESVTAAIQQLHLGSLALPQHLHHLVTRHGGKTGGLPGEIFRRDKKSVAGHRVIYNPIPGPVPLEENQLLSVIILMQMNPEQKTAPARRDYRYFDLVMALFVTVLITSNIASSAKIVDWGFSLFGVRMAFDAGTLLFPISYIFGDVLTEAYGFKTRGA